MSRVLALTLLLAIAASSAGCGALDVGRVVALCAAHPRNCN